MFRATVRVDERVDAATEAATLKANAIRAGLKSAAADELAESFGASLRTLVDNGRKLQSLGSQMEVKRVITGSGYSVKLIFGAGRPRGFFERLRQVLRRR